MKDKLDDMVLKMVTKSLETTQIDFMLEMIKEADLCTEFFAFIEDDANQFTSGEAYFTEFAKLHPDKFYVVPEEQRYYENFGVMNDKKR